MDVAELARRINAIDRPRGVLYVSGGGTEVLPMLLGRGGGSATLLSARVPYAPDDFRAALGCDPGRLVDARAARGLAMAAFRHALSVRGDLPADSVFGLGATAKLSRGEGEREGRSHEIHAAVQSAGRTSRWSITLPDGGDRGWEERINAILLLNLLAFAKGVEGRVALEQEGRAVADGAVRESVADWRDCHHSLLPDLYIDLRRWLAYDLGRDGPREAEVDAPPPRLLLSGSFRPLHEGHVAMAEVASRMLGIGCDYELSIFHPEKAPIDYAAIRSRLGSFEGRSGRLYLTNAPTYVEKARLFPGCTFVVGHDTASRIVDPRFYGGPSGRDAMLEEVEALGARFLVFGRVDRSGTFRDFSAEEIEHPAPASFARVATPVPGQVFRLDLSSTEVRARSGGEFD